MRLRGNYTPLKGWTLSVACQLTPPYMEVMCYQLKLENNVLTECSSCHQAESDKDLPSDSGHTFRKLGLRTRLCVLENGHQVLQLSSG